MDDQNPYSSTGAEGFSGDLPETPVQVLRVPTIAILMILHGAALLVGSLFTGMAAGAMGYATAAQQNEEMQEAMQDVPEGMMEIMLAVYGVITLLFFLGGILQIVAGVYNLRYRRRVFGIVGLFSGLVSMVTVMCAPISIGLVIYGMIIYLNENVKRAFELGDSGWSKEKIQSNVFID